MFACEPVDPHKLRVVQPGPAAAGDESQSGYWLFDI